MFRVWSLRRGIAVSPLADFTPSPNTRTLRTTIGVLEGDCLGRGWLVFCHTGNHKNYRNHEPRDETTPFQSSLSIPAFQGNHENHRNNKNLEIVFRKRPPDQNSALRNKEQRERDIYIYTYIYRERERERELEFAKHPGRVQ